MRQLRSLATFIVGLVVLLSCTLPAGQGRADSLECHHLPALFRTYESKHYAVERIDAELRERAANEMVRALDPSKTLFLQGEPPRLAAEIARVFESMKQGQCGVLDAAYNLALERTKEDLKWVRELTAGKFVLDESVSIVTNPSKRDYPATSKEREQRVRDMVHFQISNYLTSGLALSKAKKQLVHRYELAVKRLEEQRKDLPEVLAGATALALDPHTAYLSPETLADFEIQMHLSLEGIGAVLSPEDGFTVVESIVPGGAADKNGKLRPKDKIIAVAQDGEDPVSVIDMALQDVVKLIRGKKDTKVTLTVLREGEATETFNVTITRAKIDVKSQAAKLDYQTFERDGRKVTIGVLDLPSFYGGDERGRSSFEDVRSLLAEAKQKKVDGVVLDLSRNGGGLLNEAVRIAGLFLKEGPVVATKDSDGRFEVLVDEDPAVQWSGPLVVLISAASASASEILAGALKDYGRAVVVGGQRTFGKGSVQAFMPLPDKAGAIKVTIGMFFLPKGASTQEVGVTSDILIPSPIDGLNLSESELDYHLASQRVTPFVSAAVNGAGPTKWQPVAPATLSKLAQRSKSRVAVDAELQKVVGELAEIRKNDGVLRLADVRRRALEAKNAEKNGSKAEEDAEAKLEGKREDSAVVREAAQIAADLVVLQRSA